MKNVRLPYTLLGVLSMIWLQVIIRGMLDTSLSVIPNGLPIPVPPIDLRRLIFSSILLSSYTFILGIIEIAKQKGDETTGSGVRVLPVALVFLAVFPAALAYMHEGNIHDLTQRILNEVWIDEDFEDISPGMDPTDWVELSGNWTTVDEGGNNVYYQSDSREKKALSMPTTGNYSWVSYYYEADIKFVDGNPKKKDRGALLLFRYKGGNSYYFLWLKEHLDQLELYNHGAEGGGNAIAIAQCNLEQGVWYHVKISINGQMARVSLDDIPVFRDVDMGGSYDEGGVGMGTRYYRVKFDNIHVEPE